MRTDIADTAHAADAATLLALLPHRPRVIALGEPTHFADPLLDLRNTLYRQLVEQHGPCTIAIESDCMKGLLVDDYVTSGTGTLDNALEHGFSHGFGACAANRALLRWMRAYNEDRPADRRLRFAGFDGPLEMTGAESPRHALTALHDHLAAHLDPGLLPCTAATLDRLLGPDEPWTDPDAALDPARSIGASAEAERLWLLADDLAALLDSHAPHLATASSREEWDRARLYARTARGLLRYHSWMAADTPGRVDRLMGLRDLMMADNLSALAERGPVLAHAHNGHLQRDKSRIRLGDLPVEWWSAGAIVGARLGGDYAFVATALGTLRHQGVDAPPPDTLEGILYTGPRDRFLVDPARLAAALDTPPAPRESPWHGYIPFDPAHLATTDGLLFVKDVPEP